MQATNPKVFISYSRESDEHTKWVVELATRLDHEKIEVLLDEWCVHPGDDLPAFMEMAVRESTHVVLICTPRYKAKADSRDGGVGYEGGLIIGQVMTGVNGRKFIPVWRHGSSWGEASPDWCKTKRMIDMRSDPTDLKGFEDLLRTLRGTRPRPPSIGSAAIPAHSNSSLGALGQYVQSTASSVLGDKRSEWMEIKRLITQNRPLSRQEALNRWSALSSSNDLPPPEVIQAVERIITDAATDDEVAYALLLQIQKKETPESRNAIVRLTGALAQGVFAVRPKTGLNLAYAATKISDARECLLRWLEVAQSERDIEPALHALLYMSQSYSAEIEPLFERIERICERYPRDVSAQRTYKALTNKDLSNDPLVLESQVHTIRQSNEPATQSRGGSLNVPKGFNINAARHRARMVRAEGGIHSEVRKGILSACYARYMESSSLWFDVLGDFAEEQRASVIREIEWLASHGYLKSKVAMDHTSAMVKLTTAGRDFYEAMQGRVAEEESARDKFLEIRQGVLSVCYEQYMESSSIWSDIIGAFPEDQHEAVVREVEWLTSHGYIKSKVAMDHTIAMVQLTPAGRDFFERKQKD